MYKKKQNKRKYVTIVKPFFLRVKLLSLSYSKPKNLLHEDCVGVV